MGALTPMSTKSRSIQFAFLKSDQDVKTCIARVCKLGPKILFANIDISRHILVVDTSVVAKSNMGRREYY
jgi:hypothetical protein